MPQPVEVKGGVFLWIWGEIQGFDKGDEYISRFQSHQNSSIEFCSELYKERGEDFISDLNGEFSGVIYDSNDAEVILFNDRLGSRPVYYSKIDNSLIFSTQTQAILNYPETNSAIDVEMLAEFLSATYGSLGTRTIFRNIKELHPASKLKYKIKEGDSNNKIYWIPKYKPKNKPFSYFTKKFKEAIKKAVAERTAENDTNYGLLISGGSDSRLLVSLLEEVTCYHMNEHMNEEAKISQRVSKESGNEFVFLKRGIDYQEKVLERGGKITNFNGWFNQGHLLGFSEEISNEVDVLLSGTWADALLQGYHLPKKKITVPCLGKDLSIPIMDYKGPSKFLADKYNRIPNYLKSNGSIDKIIANNISNLNSSIESHGIHFQKKDDIIHSGITYPITNAPAFFDYYSHTQITRTKYPFLDNRIIDLSLEMPWKYHLRKNLIRKFIRDFSPNLAKIKRGDSFLPLYSPYKLGLLATKITRLKKKLDSKEHQGPWTDHEKNIRESDFVLEKIKEREEMIKNCSFLDYESAIGLYKEHQRGLDNTDQLYALLSFIGPDVIKNIIG